MPLQSIAIYGVFAKKINLIGEHTDYNNNGYAFPASIDKYIICALSKTLADKFASKFGHEMDFNSVNISNGTHLVSQVCS